MWPGQIFFRSLEWLNFWLVWPSSVDGDLHNCIISTIAIYAIVIFCRSHFHTIVFFCQSRFTWSCYFSWSEVWTLGQTVQFFYWSWVWFPGQIACFRPVWFMAYVTCPHKWGIRVMGKKPHGREKMPGDFVKHKTLVERETEFSWDIFQNKVLLS